MQTGKKLLCFIVQTAKSEQLCIQTMLNMSMRPALRKGLEGQLVEYESIERQAYAIGSSRGWDMPDNLAAQFMMKNITTRITLHHGNTDSRIADQMILRNTKAMIRTVKYRNQYLQPDGQIDALSQKLLDCETANIRQMQSFL